MYLERMCSTHLKHSLPRLNNENTQKHSIKKLQSVENTLFSVKTGNHILDSLKIAQTELPFLLVHATKGPAFVYIIQRSRENA